MKKIKKRGAVYGVVALLLCTAAYLNWSYVEPPADLLQTDGSSADSASAASDDGAAAGEDYFASSRLTREKARDEAVSTLKELSESADADETAKEDAASQISALAAASVQEANIESLIRAKGYADAVVMLSDGSANTGGFLLLPLQVQGADRHHRPRLHRLRRAVHLGGSGGGRPRG